MKNLTKTAWYRAMRGWPVNGYHRVNIYDIQDKMYLSWLFDLYLTTLENSPIELKMKYLAWDSRIPESIFARLRNLHHNPDDAPNINVEDLHIIFRNTLFRFPTVKMWRHESSGEILFEM